MAKKASGEKRYYVLPNNERFEITGENGTYYVCGFTQFRKSANYGRVETEEPQKQEKKNKAAEAAEKEGE